MAGEAGLEDSVEAGGEDGGGGGDGGVRAIGTGRRRARLWLAARIAGWIALAVGAALFLLVAFLHTPPGRQFIIDRIASYAPASGLSVEVGEIDGSVLWSATFHDVRLRDARGTLFLEVPEVDLNWRPYKFPFSGLDVRHLVLSGGTLHAAPELLPGDPDAPILPGFDIRVDLLLIDDLTVAEGLLGAERRIDFRARTDIRDGLALLDAEGRFGGSDVFSALAHVEPEADRFDLDLDYRAPAGGFLAAMTGVDGDLEIRLRGEGSWSAWAGRLEARDGEGALADLGLAAESGRYRVAGEVDPSPFLDGLAARALGEAVELSAGGRLSDGIVTGSLVFRGRGLAGEASGAIDLAGNQFETLQITANLLDPGLLGGDVVLSDARLAGTLAGPFRDFTMPLELRVREVEAGGFVVRDVVQRGTLARDGAAYTLPVDLTAARVVSGAGWIDPRLVGGRLRGMLVLRGDRLSSDDLALRFPGLAGDLALRADLSGGAIALEGPVVAERLAFGGIGTVSARARGRVVFGTVPWSLAAQVEGRVTKTSNETIAGIAGDDIRFRGSANMGRGRPILFSDTRVSASKLELWLDGRLEGGTTILAGRGEHVDYGKFDLEAELAREGPRAVLVFADPLPAAGITGLRLAVAPSRDGLGIEAAGGSLLGPFDGLLELVVPRGGPARIAVQRLDVSNMRISGNLALEDGAVAGTLALARGGVDGRIALSPADGGQGFDVSLDMSDARFGGETPLAINEGSVKASGYFGRGGTSVEGEAWIAGLGYGGTFLRRVAAQASIVDGSGTIDAAIAGRRGSRFELLVNGAIAPGRIALAVDGSYAGRAITMPRRAVLSRLEDGGWRLARAQLGFGRGHAIAEGRFGGDRPTQGQLSLSRMPLTLVDVLTGDLAIGGTISGVVDLAADEEGLPTGTARVKVAGLTRSGLVLSSTPIDLALVAELSPDLLQARAVVSGSSAASAVEDRSQDLSGNTFKGRFQGRIAGLPAAGSLIERLRAGSLAAQFRYDGPAASLWRLTTLDLLDVTGSLRASVDIGGTLADPRVTGSLAGDDLRLRSALTGTDISAVSARGRFAGSRFNLSRFSGTAPNGGQVSGSGYVDLAGMGASRGPRLDLRIAARNAEILDLPNMGARVTGPMRIISSGSGGTIAGKLDVRGGRWRLGQAADSASLPDMRVREINRPPDIAPATRSAAPWRYLIDARAGSGIEVDGMGLDSEWRGAVSLRGTTDAPRIEGEVEIVPRRGFYSFAGTRFEITRGRIAFEGASPPDPQVEIVAESDVGEIDVAVNVNGRASQPEISFVSVPALPEEELLAQLLFGGSVTELSATDALQLGSALASLRGGSGLGPINQLRDAIGLDRLRIVAADPALDRGTSVALGKNISRRLYAEVITDGADYNATELEYRLTSWLSLLASVSTVGRGGVAAEYSRDY